MPVIVVKIRNKKFKGQGSYEYKNEIPLEDFKVMAILFADLETYGANIEKIYQEFKKRKGQEFPF
jgi:hypothetical protein